jgi:hypothetical protein
MWQKGEFIMRRRMVYALTLAVMVFVAVNTSYAQGFEEKVQTVSVKFDCVMKTGDLIVAVNKGSEFILLSDVNCKYRKDRIRKFILNKTLGKVVTVDVPQSRAIIPSGDILLPGGQSLQALVAAKFPGRQ